MKQLALYFLLSYGISWLIWLPQYAPHTLAISTWHIPYNHALGGLGPMLAAYICTAWFDGRKAVYALLKATLLPRTWLYAVIALVSPLLILLLAVAAGYLSGNGFPSMTHMGRTDEFPQWDAAAYWLYNMVFFGWGEEVGWRGFALPRMQRQQSALAATLWLTVMWAGWHIPLFLYRPSYMLMELAGIIGWLMSLLTGSILLTWLFNASRGSVLACAIFHATIDIAFMSDIPLPNVMNIMGAIITCWGIAVLLWYKPVNIAHLPRVTHIE